MNEKKSNIVEIMEDLHMLSIIRENQKFNVRDLTTISSWGIFQATYRYVTGENRRLTLIWLQRLSKRITDEILWIDTSDPIHRIEKYKDLSDKLNGGLIGLNNLLNTYTRIDSSCDTCTILSGLIKDYHFYITYIKSKK